MCTSIPSRRFWAVLVAVGLVVALGLPMAIDPGHLVEHDVRSDLVGRDHVHHAAHAGHGGEAHSDHNHPAFEPAETFHHAPCGLCARLGKSGAFETSKPRFGALSASRTASPANAVPHASRLPWEPRQARAPPIA